MDLFSDFSFAAAGATSRRSAYLPDLEMESVSPSSSRSTTPVAGEPAPFSPVAPPVSMDQLSVRLHHQHIDPAAFPTASPLCVRLQKASERRAAVVSIPGGPDHFDAVRRRRAEGARHLFSSQRRGSIETLVDRMLRDGTSCYASLHPSSAASSRQASRNNSITSAPTSMPSPNLRRGSDDMTSEDDSEDSPTSPTDLRLAHLRFGSGVAAATRKSSGIEKASKSRRKLAGKR